tara:strand:- start:195 stop:1250 length:1056 start_codon:yes stop_codon:yes gene_type:complete
MNTNRSILFILPVASHPRFSKRINSYLKLGFKVTVLSFERDYFNKNTLPNNIEFISLGEIKSKKYFRRIPVLLSAIFKILRTSKNKDSVYIFSQDILIFHGLFIKKSKIIYEIGDLRIIKNWLIQQIINFLNRIILSKISKVVVTSEGFLDFLIMKYQLPRKKIEIIENKFPKGFLDSKCDFKSINEDYIVGIVGNFRYSCLIDFLMSYSNQSKKNKFKIMLFGGGELLPQIMSYVDDTNIFYCGQFKYPDDLNEIYNQIDLSFVMYDSDDINVRLALPNKLYESMAFKKPLVVSNNTLLSKKVHEYGVGFSWSKNEMTELNRFLNSEKFKLYYNALKGNFEKFKPEIYSS